MNGNYFKVSTQKFPIIWMGSLPDLEAFGYARSLPVTNVDVTTLAIVESFDSLR